MRRDFAHVREFDHIVVSGYAPDWDFFFYKAAAVVMTKPKEGAYIKVAFCRDDLPGDNKIWIDTTHARLHGHRQDRT